MRKVIKPGNPPYLEYVRSSVAEKKAKFEQEGRSGNPNLVYNSQFVEGWEPSGVPVSIQCLSFFSLFFLSFSSFFLSFFSPLLQ
jgi:hypothetical protein